MESFVVRIYRRVESDPQHIVGIIEIVEAGRQQRFSDMQELWEVLSPRDPRPRVKTARARKRKDP